MIVRQFIKEKDFDDCIKTFINVFNCPPWNDEWTYEKAKEFLLDYINHPSFLGFVCEDEQIQKGYLLGYIFKWWDTHHYYINEMFIKSLYKGQGIGKFLLNEVKKILRQKNIGSIMLLTMRNTQAEQFYLKNGFYYNECMIQMICDL
ncbi:MAG: GNAT family N-acetyltransferase [Candidatus Woesearchaeota archaeon]